MVRASNDRIDQSLRWVPIYMYHLFTYSPDRTHSEIWVEVEYYYMCVRVEKARLTDSADLARAYLIQGDAPKVHYNNKIFFSPKVIVKFV